MKTVGQFPAKIKPWLKSKVSSDVWETCGRVQRFARQLPTLHKLFHGQPQPDIILFFGGAPGDDLLCTNTARELKSRGIQTIWMVSQHPSIYLHNPDIARVIRPGPWVSVLRDWWPERVPTINYAIHDPVSDRCPSPTEHIVAIMGRQVGIRGSISVVPYLRLTSAERNSQTSAAGAIAIQSSGLNGLFPMLNKQWLPERFQEVVNSLRPHHRVIQLGSASDPALSGVTDLRGKTTIREAAAILSNCALYVGNVGMLMHLARAVECPSVILYGGRELPTQSGYACNFHLTSHVPCAPCWRYNECDFNRVCMTAIASDAVLNAIDKALSTYPIGQARSLPPDQAFID